MKLRLHIGLALALGLGSLATAQDLPVMDGLQLWLDATDADTVFQEIFFEDPAEDGDLVYSWMDKSENGFEVFTPDEAGPPTYVEDGINGLPSIRFFSEFADGMVIEDSLDVQRPYTAFIVNQYHEEGDGVYGRTLQSQDINWLLGLWAGNVSHYANGWVTGIRPPAQPNTPYLVDAIGNEAESFVGINGRGTWTSDSSPTGTPGRLAFSGAGQFPAEVSDADVSEVVIYNRVLDEDELSLMRTHLMEKYAVVPIEDPPQPDETELFFGEIGTFSSAADLDFSGEFVHGVNLGGAGENEFGDPLVIGDATLADGTNAFNEDLLSDGISITVANEIAEWHAPAYAEDTDDDLNLAFAMRSIRWNVPPGLDISLPVEEGESYKLQLLFAESCCDRGFDITIEDEMAVDNIIIQDEQGGINNQSQGVSFSHELVAGDDELNITLGGAVFGTPDNNPILNVLTLEKIDDIVVDLPGDCNSDGVLSAADLDCVATIDERDAVLNALGTLPGDLNGDGNIDFPDFLTLSGNYGMENASYSEGNINLEGPIDFADFLTLSGNYGKTAAAVSSVPEPTGFVMGMLLVGGLLPFRKRR